MIEKKTRLIRLCGKYRDLRTTRIVQQVPWLTLSGLWLERAGFKTGDQVEITIENNQLIIKNCCTDGDQ